MSDLSPLELFPFPDERAAYNELLRDTQINKIPQYDREKIVSDAWHRGYEASAKYFGSGCSVYNVLSDFGLMLTRLDCDRVLCGMRYFAEFFERQSAITVYKKAVELFAESNSICYELAEEMILAHELFHYLECHGKVSSPKSVYKRTILKIGKKVLLSSTLRSISEISAYGFAYGYLEKKLSDSIDPKCLRWLDGEQTDSSVS